MVIYQALTIDGRAGKYGPFLRQKVDRNIIFPNYGKVLVLNFSEMGNKVFFEAKS